MIRGNLATRPFYDARVVRAVLGVAALVVLAATLVNILGILHYRRNDAGLQAQAVRDEARRSELRASAARLRGSLDAARMRMTSAETEAANELISRRTFSWTELLNQFEATLPSTARITSIRPRVSGGGPVVLEVMVVGRSVEDVDRFLQNLEDTGYFLDSLSRDERINDQGQLEAFVEARYVPGAAGPGQVSSGSRQAAP